MEKQWLSLPCTVEAEVCLCSRTSRKIERLFQMSDGNITHSMKIYALQRQTEKPNRMPYLRDKVSHPIHTHKKYPTTLRFIAFFAGVDFFFSLKALQRDSVTSTRHNSIPFNFPLHSLAERLKMQHHRNILRFAR